MQFTTHIVETAPEGSQPLLEKSLKARRMIPNLRAVIAESPQSLQVYQDLHHLFAQTPLTAEERNVVWPTVSTANECHYCGPAHTAIAHMDELEQPRIEALRSGESLADAKLESLRQFTLALVKKNGQASNEEQAAFLIAGYEPKHAREVLVGITQKTLSNLVIHLAQTPLDDFANKYAWTPSLTNETRGAL